MGASIREIAHRTYGLVRLAAVTGVTELRFPASKQQKRGPLGAPPGFGFGSLADLEPQFHDVRYAPKADNRRLLLDVR